MKREKKSRCNNEKLVLPRSVLGCANHTNPWPAYRCGHHLRNWQLGDSALNSSKNKNLTREQVPSSDMAIRTRARYGGVNYGYKKERIPSKGGSNMNNSDRACG